MRPIPIPSENRIQGSERTTGARPATREGLLEVLRWISSMLWLSFLFNKPINQRERSRRNVESFWSRLKEDIQTI